ncbi:MAG: outer membrane protein transport protein [gamma proteobacterium symbiont of Bathyaustriella thionipta]|nr:outer membrane protein transport protein [gamma proteobacterium symbiont of Bathyaustriella thionipta]
MFFLGFNRFRSNTTYDETPINDNYFSARIPGDDRQLFSVGVGHTFSGGWQLEGGYMYVKVDDRNYKGKKTFTGGDVNGTSALNGKYETSVHLFGLGINKSFSL